MAILDIKSNVSINYSAEGNGEHTLLLFNGATLAFTAWGSLATRLAEHYRVIRFDQRNAGGTVFNGDFTLNDTAADAAAVLGHLGVEDVTVIGHAWGGRAAQVFVRDYPHLVSRLVICGTGGQFPPKSSGEQRQAMADAARSGDRATWEMCFAGMYFAPGFRERAPTVFTEIADAAWQRPAGKARWNPKVSPSSSYWGSAGVPTLLIYGDEDKNGTPENARDLCNRLPDAHLITLADAGHFAIREAEDQVLAQIRDFVD